MGVVPLLFFWSFCGHAHRPLYLLLRRTFSEFHEELLYETVTVVLVSPRDLQASVAVVLVFEAGRPLGPVRKCDSCPALSVGKFVAVVLNGLSLANKCVLVVPYGR